MTGSGQSRRQGNRDYDHRQSNEAPMKELAVTANPDQLTIGSLVLINRSRELRRSVGRSGKTAPVSNVAGRAEVIRSLAFPLY